MSPEINKMIEQLEMAVCTVCKYVDRDSTPKLCKWCRTCKAWICTKDSNKWKRRTLAMTLRLKAKRPHSDAQSKTSKSTCSGDRMDSIARSDGLDSDPASTFRHSSLCDYSAASRCRDLVLYVLSAIRVQVA